MTWHDGVVTAHVVLAVLSFSGAANHFLAVLWPGAAQDGGHRAGALLAIEATGESGRGVWRGGPG